MIKDLLIELWIANEFIPSQGDVSLYVLGEEIFSCLVQSSFFQDVVEKDVHTGVICKMHDLMHALAQYEMRHDCWVIGKCQKHNVTDEFDELEAFRVSNEDKVGELGEFEESSKEVVKERMDCVNDGIYKSVEVSRGMKKNNDKEGGDMGRLTSAAIQEVGLLWGLENDLLALNNTFKQIQGVLHDAEKRQKTQKDVEEWHKTLKSASLEVENMFNEA
uniref:Disease resistance protein n=1 Tax=Tanacetum cinerariifolium TaxID=118510 RepID=A0A6L2LHE3_TANCI|nr:disease resistance protein [Tanacetum cinerariifolium]